MALDCFFSVNKWLTVNERKIYHLTWGIDPLFNNNKKSTHFFRAVIFSFLKKYFIVVQLQLSAFSPHHSPHIPTFLKMNFSLTIFQIYRRNTKNNVKTTYILTCCHICFWDLSWEIKHNNPLLTFSYSIPLPSFLEITLTLKVLVNSYKESIRKLVN